MKLFFIGNWKMNMLRTDAQQFFQGFREVFTADSDAEVGIAPPFTALPEASREIVHQPHLLLGAQNVHWLESGAHTGEISPPMLKEYGVQFVILGHSERRQFYGETDETVAKRARAAIDHGIRACVCLGEEKEQFEAGATTQVVVSHLRKSLSLLTPNDLNRLVVCYEPVWAIGTGLAATPDQAAAVHRTIRSELREIFRTDATDQVRVLYGGSTTPANIGGFTACPDIHGAIVGGASLDPEKFSMLVENGLRAQRGAEQ